MSTALGPAHFATTRWSMVARAVGSGEDQQAALSALCGLYWRPLYSFVRRSGHDADEAADLTQEFLARFLERRDLEKTSPERGRFRSYLLQAMRNFLANEWRRGQAHKRGGGASTLSLDAELAEDGYRAEPVEPTDPEQLYLRRFAMTAVSQALARLEQDCVRADKAALFSALRPSLLGEMEAGELQQLAAALTMSPGALKVAAHRLRRRFQELVREQVADTLDDPAQIDAELRALLAAL